MDFNEILPNAVMVAVVLLGLIVLFDIIGLNLNPVEDDHIEKVVTVEGFDIQNFCKSHGSKKELESSCKTLSKKNCTATSCCVYAKLDGDERCYAGDKHGPIYKYDKNGKTNNLDYYYYKDKCYGKDC